MMDLEELKKYKEITGYNLSQLEKDFFQNIILEYIYKEESAIYFKGGTALQKVYGIKRFSEDLDFNYEDVDLNKLISRVISFLKQTGHDCVQKDKHSTKFGTTFVISIEGFLFQNTENTKCNITLDFRHKDTYLKPEKKLIEPVYDELNDYILLCLNIEEIASEKVRAICTRYKARDIYDLYKLIKKEIRFNLSLINKKLGSYDITFNNSDFRKKVIEKNNIYDDEMKQLVDAYPDFDTCKKTIFKWIE